MSSQVNSLQNVLSSFQDAKAKGPVLVSEAFEPQLGSRVTMVEFTVSNKSKLPTELPFGVLGEIVNEKNSVESRVKLRIGPGFFEGSVAWPEYATGVKNLNEYVATGTRTIQVVPKGYDISTLSTTGVWEAEVSPIDNVHALLTVVHVVTVLNAVEDSWDERFRLYVSVTKLPTQTKVNSSVAASTGGFTKIESQILRPTWWLKMTSVYTIPATGFRVENLNEYVQVASVVQTLVAYDFDMTALSTVGLWGAEMTPINALFSLLIKTYVITPINMVEDVWDDEVEGVIQVTKTITQTYVAPALSGTFPTITHSECKVLRPTWWLRVTEAFTYGSSGYPIEVVIPLTADIPLPSVLTGITVVWNEGYGVGGFATDWAGASMGTSWALTGSENGEAQSSASLQPDVVIEIKETWGRSIPTKGCFFYLPFVSGVITQAAVITKLTAFLGATVQWWPKFYPTAHSIAALGMKVSVSARASANASAAASGTNVTTDKTQGEGTSFDVSTSNGVTRIPPTIHGAITVSNTTKSRAVSATAAVAWTGGGTPIPMPSADASSTIAATAVGAVSPSSFGATTPAAIPSSGLYILDMKIEKSKWGVARCFAEVLDASNL